MPGREGPERPISQNQDRGSRFGATSTGSPINLKKYDAKTAMSNGVGDSESHATGREEEDDGFTEIGGEVQPPNIEHSLGEDDGASSGADNVTAIPDETVAGDRATEAQSELEDDGEDVVPVGSVDSHGQVLDREGNVVGTVQDNIPEGSLVDSEGDVLDVDGNIIGKADVSQAAESVKTKNVTSSDAAPSKHTPSQSAPSETAKSKAPPAETSPEVASEGAKSEAPEVEKNDLGGPFGVQDNGDVTNAAGVPIGILAEGDPVDIVGRSIREIDTEGNLKAETGSTLGKVELNSKVREEGEQALHEIPEDVEESLEKGSKAPTSTTVKNDSPELDSASEAPEVDEEKLKGASEKLGFGDPEFAQAKEGSEALKDASKNAGSEIDTGTAKPKEGTEALQGASEKLGSEIDTGTAKPKEGTDALQSTSAKLGSDIDVGSTKSKEGTEALQGASEKLGSEIETGSAKPKEGTDALQSTSVKLGSDFDVGSAKPKEGSQALEGSEKAASDVTVKAPEAEKALEVPEVQEPQDFLGEDAPTVSGATDLSEAHTLGDTAAQMPEGVDFSILKGLKVNKLGKIVNEKGTVVGQLVEGDPKKLAGKRVDEEGKIWNDAGKIIGRAEPLEEIDEAPVSQPFEDFPDAVCDAKGNVLFEGRVVGKVVEGDAKTLEGKKVDADGDILDKNGNSLGRAERYQEEEPVEEEPEAPEVVNLSALEGKKVNKAGNVVDDHGKLVGRVIEGVISKLVDKKCDAQGQIWGPAGKVIGRAELIPLDELDDVTVSPFEDFPDAVVDAKGNVIFEGEIVGRLIEGDATKLAGKKVDQDGEVIDKIGNVLGKAERWTPPEAEAEPEPEPIDMSALAGKRVNKAGNVVDDHGALFGRVIEGAISKLVGKKCDGQGQIWGSAGKVIGRAELIPVDELDDATGSPFEDFPDAVVDAKGNVIFEGEIVGRLIEGDATKLAGKKVDQDGEVVDKIGNVLGKAERWTPPEVEAEPEPEPIDMSALAGKRVNKVGNVVDSHGQIYGRLVEGDPTRLAGRMCDKNGNILSEMGEIIGRAELVAEGERDGVKTGPFTDFENPTVTKDGKVADERGIIIGRLIAGDVKALFGKHVDPDGDILDQNGNSIGRAERWEEEEKVIEKHPAAGRKVNKRGEVVDENGDVIAKLTDGDFGKCAGKSIDNDGDVVDGKGSSIGHVTLLEDIPEPEPEPEPEVPEPEVPEPEVEEPEMTEEILEPEPEPEEPQETEEEKDARKAMEADRKLAGQLASVIDNTIDRIKPILKMIFENIDAENSKPEADRDEQKLVDVVKPLIQEGGQILTECNGAVRALDPDGRIQASAKHKTASHEASPEEHRLAESLKELTTSVTTAIDNAKKKIAGMPHVKQELNPLWGLLAEPLGQILAAVGLLLSGVLGLVGRLLSVLGLGGLLDNLLGGLGIKGILKGLGLGTLTSALTGKK